MRNDGVANTYVCDKTNVDSVPRIYKPKNVSCIKQSERKRTNIITNCLIYKDLNANVDQCIKCATGYFVAEDGLSCVQTCPNQLALDYYIEGQVNADPKYIKFRQHKCINDNQYSNCSIIARSFDVNPNEKFVCIKCKPNMQKIDTFANVSLPIAYNPNTISYTNIKYEYGVTYTGFECEPIQTDKIYKTTQTLLPPVNCEVYELGQDNEYLCRKCKFGYTGEIEPQANFSMNYRCNIKIEDCDLDTYYGGFMQLLIPHVMNVYEINRVNCHKCLSEDRIPFLFMTDQTNVLTPFRIEYGDDPVLNQQNGSEFVQCLEPRAESFGMREERFES